MLHWKQAKVSILKHSVDIQLIYPAAYTSFDADLVCNNLNSQQQQQDKVNNNNLRQKRISMLQINGN